MPGLTEGTSPGKMEKRLDLNTTGSGGRIPPVAASWTAGLIPFLDDVRYLKPSPLSASQTRVLQAMPTRFPSGKGTSCLGESPRSPGDLPGRRPQTALL